MRNWLYLILGIPAALYIALLSGDYSVLIHSIPLHGTKNSLACTYFTGTRIAVVREEHFCDRLHVLVRTDHQIH